MFKDNRQTDLYTSRSIEYMLTFIATLLLEHHTSIWAMYTKKQYTQ